MNELLLIISVLSTVSQNGILNFSSKKQLKNNGYIYYFNALMYLICFILFAVFAISTGLSWYTIVLGIIFGIVTNSSNICKIHALAKGPMHITILITTSSMIIPALSGVILFGEDFSIPKLIACVFLIFFVFVASSKNESTGFSKKWALYCLSTFLLMGTIGVLQKIHQNSAYKDELFGFLMTAFLCSLLFAFIMARKERKKIQFEKKQILFAFICGVYIFDECN